MHYYCFLRVLLGFKVDISILLLFRTFSRRILENFFAKYAALILYRQKIGLNSSLNSNFTGFSITLKQQNPLKCTIIRLYANNYIAGH